jgi:hypothetical protein
MSTKKSIHTLEPKDFCKNTHQNAIVKDFVQNISAEDYYYIN